MQILQEGEKHEANADLPRNHTLQGRLFGAAHLPTTSQTVSSCLALQVHIHCQNIPAARTSGHRAITPTRNISSITRANHHKTQKLHEGNTTAFSLKQNTSTSNTCPQRKAEVFLLYMFSCHLLTLSWEAIGKERDQATGLCCSKPKDIIQATFHPSNINILQLNSRNSCIALLNTSSRSTSHLPVRSVLTCLEKEAFP